MIQVLDAPEQTPSFGARIGAAIGSGLSGGVEQHFQQKYAKEALKAKEEAEMRKLKQEYLLKGDLEKDLQGSKFKHEKEQLDKELTGGKYSNKQLKEKPDAFKDAVTKKMANEYLGIEDQILKTQSGLEDIGAARKKVTEARSITGWLGHKTGLGSAGTELETIGHTLLEPILKIFNPAGVLPQSKLEILRGIYTPRATDTEAVANAKLNGLERLYNRSLKILQTKKQLIENFGGYIPPDIEAKINKQIDMELNEEIGEMKINNPEKPPLTSFVKK